MTIARGYERPDAERVRDLRRRVRAAMEQSPATLDGPARIEERYMSEPLPVRKARAIALKLSVILHKGNG